MRQETSIGFALGRLLNVASIIRTSRLAAGAGLFFACAALSGCADDPNSTYPSLSKITGLGDILTPEERQKAVQDLEKQQQGHVQAAAKDIQKQQ